MSDKCRNGAYGLHDYGAIVVSDATDHVEECVQCGHRAFYKVIDGRVEKERYRRDHERDYIQPGDPRFERIYGTEGVKALKEIVERKIAAKAMQSSMVEEARDHLRTLKRFSVSFSK